MIQEKKLPQIITEVLKLFNYYNVYEVNKEELVQISTDAVEKWSSIGIIKKMYEYIVDTRIIKRWIYVLYTYYWKLGHITCKTCMIYINVGGDFHY